MKRFCLNFKESYFRKVILNTNQQQDTTATTAALWKTHPLAHYSFKRSWNEEENKKIISADVTHNSKDSTLLKQLYDK